MTVIFAGLGLIAVPVVRWKCRYGSQREILKLLAEERVKEEGNGAAD